MLHIEGGRVWYTRPLFLCFFCKKLYFGVDMLPKWQYNTGVPDEGATLKTKTEKTDMNKTVKSKKLVVESKPMVFKMPRWPKWRIEEMCGYEPKTTFWDDFWIGLYFGGEEGVRDTYRRAFKEWKNDVEYVTELVLVLNWMIWALYEVDEPMARVFDELWREADKWCMSHLEGEDLRYYERVTD